MNDLFYKISPLCVDLDGTLIYEDVMWVSWRNLFLTNPMKACYAFVWLAKGRAYFKKKLAFCSSIDPKKLTYNTLFLEFLKEYKKTKNPLILVTATDKRFADAVASYLDIFDDVVASEGVKNLRAQNKATVLVQRFGYKKFTYAGNSKDDLKVWPSAKYAIAVNISSAVKAKTDDSKNYFIKCF